jgi:Asp-tRNA(Asn)/Glu-tRNA(Gln) amidotransferase A subunit family amidase
LLANCVARDRLRASILRQMADIPILLSPVANIAAFRHYAGTWRGGASYRETMRPAQWLNLVGLPAVTVPMQFSEEDLPVGVQLIARPNEEDFLLEVAARLERERGAWPNPKI